MTLLTPRQIADIYIEHSDCYDSRHRCDVPALLKHIAELERRRNDFKTYWCEPCGRSHTITR